MEKDIFTPDQVAEILELHPKTVRRYIREGQLNARKIGGHWRINKKELDLFMGTDTPTVREHNTESKSIINGINRNIKTKVRVSSIVDIFVEDKEEALRISSSIFAAMNGRDPSYGDARCDYLFDESEQKARFILWGSPAFMSTMLSLISAISSDES